MSLTTTLEAPRPAALAAAPVARPTSSRRRLLVGLAAATVAATAVQATKPTPAAAAEDDALLHLLRRATFGLTPALVAAAQKQGAADWLAAQLDPSSVDDTEMDALLKRWPRLDLRAWEVREQIVAGSYAKWDLMYDVVQSHLARAIWSQRQLFEVTVDFWTNHLVIPTPIGEVYDSSHLFSRDVVRKHAFGKYSDMLAAAARHPAMLNVLDNAMSSKKIPNENYGRELLELHTVGVGNYTEADVKNSALALTGLGIDPEGGVYEFKPWRRYVGAIKVMGWSSSNASPEGGEDVALSYLSYLAQHPKTAERIATKLCVRFVSDTPPAALVAKLAQVYLDNDTAIVPVLKALFASAEFGDSVGQKIRTPYEDAIATVRILGLRPEASGAVELQSLYWGLKDMGQAPMGWPAPNGYPDVSAAWTGTASTLARWNFHTGVAAVYKLKGMPRPTLAELLGTPPATHGEYVDALAARLCLIPLTTEQRTAVCTFLGKKPTDPLKATDAALGWQFKYVVGLLLDSHNFAAR